MLESLPSDLCYDVDVPEVESSVYTQVAQLTLFDHQLWHRIEGLVVPFILLYNIVLQVPPGTYNTHN
jgi:hypothetical protein